VPAAGPYYVAAHTLGESVVLKRNPNYHGPRPHHVAEIDIELDVSPGRSMRDVESGLADYNFGAVGNQDTDPARLRKLYGPGSGAAKRGHQRWFENPTLGINLMWLNTSRPLFASARMRRALSFALDRTALANVYSPPAIPTDHYLPPGMPGYRNQHVYPLRPDVAAARRLAGPGRHGTAVIYAGSGPRAKEVVRIVTQDLATIGIGAAVHAIPLGNYFEQIQTRGEPFDIAVSGGWNTDFLDPAGMLVLFDGRHISAHGNVDMSYFNDPAVDARLDAASRLTGQARYRAYGLLDLELARDYAPILAYSVPANGELFSARIGCRIYQPINDATDLAALCIRP
jgi:peptide/nickel transport system substrate-binding protein